MVAHDTKTETSLTLATATDGSFLTKRWHRGRAIGATCTAYDRAFTHVFHTRTVGSAKDIADLIEAIADDPHTAILRDKLPEGVDVLEGRRLAANFADEPTRVISIDVDGVIEDDGMDFLDDPAGCAAWFRDEHLPTEFAGAAMAVHLTASAGMGVGIHARLWFLADRPVTNAELREWLKGCPVDMALYSRVALNYTATPLFDGLDDPIAKRVHFVEGAATVPVPEGLEPKAAVASGEPEAAAEDIRAALAAIPNDRLDWDRWSHVGMAVFRASGGTEEGREAWRAWSAKHEAHDDDAVDERWTHWAGCSPPTKIGAGSLFQWAMEVDPSFVPPARRKRTEAVKEELASLIDWNAEPTAVEAWPEPIDVWGSMDLPAPPRGVVPATAEDFAFDLARSTGADPAGFMLAALVVAGTAIPDTVVIQPKARDPNWTEAARLWGALVGLPSTKKSPIIKRAAAPLTKLDAKLRAQSKELAKLMDEAGEPEAGGSKSAASKPPEKRCVVRDTTVEALQAVLADNPEGVCSLQDELSGWFGAMEKHANGRGGNADRGFWLQAFNGGAYSVHRIGRGHFDLVNCGVSLLGGIQPGAMREQTKHVTDDGLIQRLIPVVLRAGELEEDVDTTAVESAFGDLIAALASLRHHEHERRVRFSHAAQRVRDARTRRHLELARFDETETRLGSHFGKYDGLFARLCLIFHLIERGPGGVGEPVSVEVAEDVVAFMERFLIPHALRFYMGVLGQPDGVLADAKVLANAILTTGCERMNRRALTRGCRGVRKLTSAAYDEAARHLEAFGWIEFAESGDPVVNPRVHTGYAARAEALRAEAAAVAAVIGGRGAASKPKPRAKPRANA